MLKIGITGNIASGKSEVEKMISNYNYACYDLDKLSKEIFDNEKEKIFEIFKTLDRKAIANIVFSNGDMKKKLEEIIHPKLKENIFEIFKKEDKIVFISGALLYQAGFDRFFDKIIYIDAPYPLRLKRLQKRNNLSYDEAKKRLDAQNDFGKNKADFIIENDKTKKELKEKLDKILSTF